MRMLGEVLNDLREVLQRHVDEKSGMEGWTCK